MIRQASRILVLLLAVALTGCGREEAQTGFVARVGDRYLTVDELGDAVSSDRHGLDSAEVARRYIEQWTNTELLVAEAIRRGLRADPVVRNRVEESERSILVSALVDQLYANSATAPSATEVRAYFESHRDQLGLLEPYVRVRYIQVTNRDSAAVAARALASVDTSDTATWNALAERFSVDPAAVRDLAGTYAAETRLMADLPRVREFVSRLSPGRVSPVIEDGGLFHVVQVVDRVPAGTLPRMEWIEPILIQRLQIEGRKQLFARMVQDLRNEATARDLLELR